MSFCYGVKYMLWLKIIELKVALVERKNLHKFWAENMSK